MRSLLLGLCLLVAISMSWVSQRPLVSGYIFYKCSNALNRVPRPLCPPSLARHSSVRAQLALPMPLSGQVVRPSLSQHMASVMRCRAPVRSHGGTRSHGGISMCVWTIYILSGNHMYVLTSWLNRLSMPDRPRQQRANGLPLQRQEGEGVVPKRGSVGASVT
jgi:hypothetical protein